MSSLSQFAQSGRIKSIQRGLITIGTSSSSASITITSVNTSKSVLHYLGQSTAPLSTGPSYYYGTAYNADAYLTLTNSSTITASRTVTGADNTQYISYQIVEYY